MPSPSQPSWLTRRLQSALGRGLLRAYRSVEVQPQAFLSELQRTHGLPVRGFQDMFTLPLETVDSLAQQTITHSIRLAAMEGAGFGFFGIFSILPDTAVLAAISVHMVQRLSLIYGFEISTQQERAQLWTAAAAATAVGVDLSKEFLEKQVLERFIPRVLARIAERMGLELAERAAAKVVPVLSSALGAALNYWFIRAWGRRVQQNFRERHLAMRSQFALGVGAAPQALYSRF